MDRRGWHALGRLSGVSTALALVGSMLWSGGCSSDSSSICDANGCYTCDAYGCSPSGSGDGGTNGDGSAKPDSSPGLDASADAWTPPPAGCKYPSDCPTDKSCVNGQCVSTCTNTGNCTVGTICQNGVCVPPPPQCTSDDQCPVNAPKCANGQCTTTCQRDDQCPKGDYCYNGACIPDTRPVTNCSSTDTSACSAGQQCVDGFCKYRCTDDVTCERIDDRIPYCGVDKVCRTQAEAHPQCTKPSDCRSGQSCINNVCE